MHAMGQKEVDDQMSRHLQAIGLKGDLYQVSQDRTDLCHRCLEGVDKVASCRKKCSCAAKSQSQERTFVCEYGQIFR